MLSFNVSYILNSLLQNNIFYIYIQIIKCVNLVKYLTNKKEISQWSIVKPIKESAQWSDKYKVYQQQSYFLVKKSKIYKHKQKNILVLIIPV